MENWLVDAGKCAGHRSGFKCRRRRISIRSRLAFVVLLATGSMSSTMTAATKRNLNIVYIQTDDLGYGDANCPSFEGKMRL